MYKLRNFFKKPWVNFLLTLIWIVGMTIVGFILAKQYGHSPGISAMIAMMTAILIRFPPSPYRRY